MSVAHHAKSAVMWNAGFVLFREVLLKFGLMILLRRLLTQSDYGTFALVNGLLGFIAMFAFNNIIAHTLQVRDEKDAHWQEQFTAGAVIQLAMFIVTNLVAFTLRWLPSYAEIAPYLHVMSVLFLLDLGCEFRRKMIERQFDWKRLRVLHAIGIFMGAVASVGLALAGWGVYALLLPVLTSSLPFIYDLFIRERWRPTWTWSWAVYRPAWHFGLARIGSGLAFKGKDFLETATLVYWFGLSKLGVMNCAIGLGQMFCRTFADKLLEAVYPVLTRVNPDPQNISRVNGLVLRLVTWVAVPMAVVLAALATPVVKIYGPKWLDAIPLVPAAVVLAAAITLAQTANTLLLAANQIKRCLVADTLLLLGSVAALLLALPHGVVMYLLGVAMAQFTVFALMLFWLVQVCGLSGKGIINALFPALVGSASALGVCYVLASFVHMNTDMFWMAVAFGTIFWLVYLTVLRFGFPTQLRELMFYVPGRKYLNRMLMLGEE